MRTLFIALLVVCCGNLFSQIQFAGVNFKGSYAVNTNNHYGYLRSFPETEFPFFQSMKLGPDGKIYFTTFNTVGVIETTGLNRTVLANFISIVRSDICIAPDGKIYVTTSDNKLYRVEPDGSGRTELASIPYSYNLAISPDNWLFGVTDNFPQVLFKIRTDGSNYTVLRNIVIATDGAGTSKLSFAPNNRIYGCFRGGGPNNSGTFFRIDSNGTNFQVLYAGLGIGAGVSPVATPVYQNGKMFVTTESGGNFFGGVIIAVDTSGLAASKIFEFGSSSTSIVGSRCAGGLISGASGKLFGCTELDGTVFSVNEDGSSPTVLYSAGPSSIYYSTNYQLAPILLADSTTLIFQSNLGGFNNSGYLYSVETNGINSLLVYNHGFVINGASPIQGLIKDATNNLYGVMYKGGVGGAGLIYKHANDGSGFTVLHHFMGNQARNPNGRLTLASDGMLYGVCANGSNSSNLNKGGAIYRINTDGSGFQIIKEFNLGTGTICTPVGGFVEGSGGELYGITQDTYNLGYSAASIYRINKDGTNFSILRTLNPSTEGNTPYESLVLAGNYLYGTCISGVGNGTAFRIQTDGTNFQVLNNFSSFGSPVAIPLSGLIIASNGRLYGTTLYGGTFNRGTIYSMNIDGSDFGALFHFDGVSQGENPAARLMQATDGNIYGTAQRGGTNGAGTFFRYTIATNTFTVIRQFTTNELSTIGDLVEVPFSTTLPVNIKYFEVSKKNNEQTTISWITEKELNLDKFIIEKSINGKDFTELASVLPKQTISLSTSYEIIDANPGKSKVFYRLKLVDRDNTVSYSRIRFLDFSSRDFKLAIYPNPAKNLISINNEFKGLFVTITIVDNVGRLVYNKSVPASNNISIDVTHLSKGTYFLSASDGKESRQSLFVKD